MKTNCIMAEPISLNKIQLAEPIYFDDMVKGVVDIKAGRLVIEPNTVAKIESIVFRMVLKDE